MKRAIAVVLRDEGERSVLVHLRDASANKHLFARKSACVQCGSHKLPLYAIARSNHPNEVAEFRNLSSNGLCFSSWSMLNVNRGKNSVANERNWN